MSSIEFSLLGSLTNKKRRRAIFETAMSFKAHLNDLSKLLNLYTVHINNLDLFHKMNFILKAALQNFIAILPNKIGDNLYFLLQKAYGNIFNENIGFYIQATHKLVAFLEKINKNPSSATLCELGTGRGLLAPMLLFILTGNKKIVTLDKNVLVQFEIILNQINLITKFFEKTPDPLNIQQKERLIGLNKCQSIVEIFNYTSITYFAPFDATTIIHSKMDIDLFFQIMY